MNTNIHNFKADDRVRLVDTRPSGYDCQPCKFTDEREHYMDIPRGSEGLVASPCAPYEDLLYVRFGRKLVSIFYWRLEAVKPTPIQPKAKMTAAVLDLLKSKGSLTSLEAQGVLRCRSLSKRISELKRLGWPITRVLKEDTTGQRYARYSLQATSPVATSLGATGQTT
ncbi:hypothetical protein GJU90_13640 [Brucella sp. 10RB9210]|nr:hypothetical protein [Brucella sp. 10RB9210]